MLVWTCPITRRTMVGPVAPEGVPAAGVDEDADPNKVWWNPATEDADTVPERTSDAHVFDPVAGEWIDPIQPAEHAAIARFKRNAILSETDRRLLPDAPGDPQKWADYRQALRDMTFDAGDVSWPEPPAE